MLEDEADSGRALATVGLPDGVAAPDPDVVDNARSRLASHYPASGLHPPGTHARPMDSVRVLSDDVLAVSAVTAAARGGADHPAHPLDVGAGLVLICNLRLYLDRLEADLLDGAQQVDLSWDLIAAIIGIPAAEARQRHQVLRARPGPR